MATIYCWWWRKRHGVDHHHTAWGGVCMICGKDLACAAIRKAREAQQ